MRILSLTLSHTRSQQKAWNHANRCALCGNLFTILQRPEKCQVCGLLYHSPQVKTAIRREQTCHHRHLKPEAEEYAQRKIWEADDEREKVFRARWDREHDWKMARLQHHERQQQLALLTSIADFATSPASSPAGASKGEDPKPKVLDADSLEVAQEDDVDGEGDGMLSSAVPTVGEGHWARADQKIGVDGMSLPKLPRNQLRRDSTWRWLFPATPKPGVQMAEAFRVAYVYVSGDFWDTQTEKEALVAHILPPLHAFLAARRVSLVPVDCRIGCAVGSKYPFHILRSVLDEVRMP